MFKLSAGENHPMAQVWEIITSFLAKKRTPTTTFPMRLHAHHEGTKGLGQVALQACPKGNTSFTNGTCAPTPPATTAAAASIPMSDPPPPQLRALETPLLGTRELHMSNPDRATGSPPGEQHFKG